MRANVEIAKTNRDKSKNDKSRQIKERCSTFAPHPSRSRPETVVQCRQCTRTGFKRQYDPGGRSHSAQLDSNSFKLLAEDLTDQTSAPFRLFLTESPTASRTGKSKSKARTPLSDHRVECSDKTFPGSGGDGFTDDERCGDLQYSTLVSQDLRSQTRNSGSRNS